MRRLNGKIAVVTGGSLGIGLATAKAFVREGAHVVITGRNEAALEAAVAEIGDGAEAFRSDISKMTDLDALHVHVAARYGRLDVLFANAGGGRLNPFEAETEEDFDFTVGTNFKGTFFTVQKLLPLMTAGGSIILNSSIAGVRGTPTLSVYNATKAAVRSLARTLSAELGPRGIRTNALAPGMIDTELLLRSGAAGEMIDGIKAGSIAATPLGRLGKAEDIAATAVFLASGDSSFITGVELTVDGGMVQV